MDDVTSRRGLSRDDLGALVREVLSQPLSDRNRPIRLRMPDVEIGLLAQRIDIHEALCGGITAHITCLSPRSDLPIDSLLGVPIEVQVVTDRGGLRRFSVIVTEVRAGSSDGGLALFQLTGRDVLAVMEQRINSRVFRRKSVIEISEILLLEWRQRSASIARTFDFSIHCASGLETGHPRYPEREFTLQYNESDAAFLRRLWKRSGIGWSFTSAEVADDDTPQQRLVLFDDSWQLPKNAAGPLRFHRDAATEKRDAITLWAPVRRLVPASVRRPSWDYIDARMFDVSAGSALRQGAHGDSLAAVLQDSWIESPHTGATGLDHERLTQLRQRRHDVEGGCVQGASGVRDLAAGEWNLIEGQPELDRLPLRQREHLFIDVHHRADNNLPKALDERAQSLLIASEALPGWRQGPSERRYENRFIALQRDILYVPPWNPAEDWPAMPPLTALVVGPKDEEVHCDELGRVKLRFLGLSPLDHEHAAGAGTNGTDGDSAWVRVDFGWAGAGFGNIQPLRVGMEVQVQFLNGDPDRPVVTGVVYNQTQQPARFSHQGKLPGNRYLSGTVTREIGASGSNQLRFDDTPRQISAQLASDHAHSELNLGYLTQPRNGTRTEPRGEGVELRTDAAAAIRAARGLVLSTDARPGAAGQQLAREELMACLDAARELVQALADVARQAQAATPDPKPQQALQTAVDQLDAGSNARPGEAIGGQPVIAINGAAGLALSTPASTTLYTGENLDVVSNRDLQQTINKRWVTTAGSSISWFAAGQALPAGQVASVSLIAGRGDILAQAQNGQMLWQAAGDIVLGSNAHVSVNASGGITLTERGGAQIVLEGGNVRVECPGAFEVHAANYSFTGPGGGAPRLPRMPGQAEVHDWLALNYLDLGTGEPMAGAPYEVHFANGVVLSGTLDANGRARHETVPDSPVKQVIYKARPPGEDVPHRALEQLLG